FTVCGVSHAIRFERRRVGSIPTHAGFPGNTESLHDSPPVASSSGECRMTSGGDLALPNVAFKKEAIENAIIAGLVALMLGLAMAVFLWMPSSFYDDGFFSGPAIRFAQTGEMKTFLFYTNIYIADLPFWYPPIYFYVLGYWFTAFGCSTVSALCFYAAIAALCCIGVSLSLSRLGCSPFWCFASALFSWTVFYAGSYSGLRPEPLAWALLLIGLAFIPSRVGTLQCAGFVLGGLAIIASPRVAGWAVAFGLFFMSAS